MSRVVYEVLLTNGDRSWDQEPCDTFKEATEVVEYLISLGVREEHFTIMKVTYENMGSPVAPKLVVGDTVTVLALAEPSIFDHTEGFNNCWVDNLNAYIGTTAKIREINSLGISLVGDVHRWHFPPQALKKVKHND